MRDVMDEEQGQLSVFLAFREKCDALEAAIQALTSRNSDSAPGSALPGTNGGESSKQQIGDAGSNQRSGLDADQAAVSALRAVEELVTHFAPSVPRRDVEQMTSRVAALRASLESARSASKPKKRFAFSSRGPKKISLENKDIILDIDAPPPQNLLSEQPAPSLQAVDKSPIEQEINPTILGTVRMSSGRAHVAAAGAASGAASGGAASGGAADEPISSTRPSLSISHRANERICISPEQHSGGELTLQHRGGELTLQHLSHCHVTVRGVASALFLRHVRDCHVIVGPVSGACHVEHATGSTVAVACHQLRIHQTERADFYVRTRSRPLIEHSTGVRFAPYSREYEGLEGELEAADLVVDGGSWAHVDDFGWLRAVPSPNWSIIPEDERRRFTEA